MPTRFICLANSYKEGGRCIAGIELDTNNNPVFKNDRPKWIRPVSNTPHGEVPTHFASQLQILNIIEIDVTVNHPDSYQSENVLFNERSIRIIGNYARNNLVGLCENKDLIFENRHKVVAEDAIKSLTYSLMLISITEFEVVKKVYEDQPNKPKSRMTFRYNNHEYDLPITDPVFIQRWKENLDLLKSTNQLYLTLSLGVKWEGLHFKLIAAII